VDELRASLETKVKSHDAKINELETRRALDSKRHDDDLSQEYARINISTHYLFSTVISDRNAHACMVRNKTRPKAVKTELNLRK
jgi:hypothetical protein